MPYAHDVDGHLVRIFPGVPFSTTKLKIMTEEDAGLSLEPIGTVLNFVVNHPSNALESYSAEERERFLIVEVEESLEELKAAKLRRVLERYDTARQRFPLVLDGKAEHLQLRDNSNDYRNWATLQRRAQRQVDIGNGAAVSPIPITVESNAEYARTYQQIVDTLEAMENWGMLVLRRSQLLKRAIERAPNKAALTAIDVESAWS